jgi:hypothetical protein
MGLQAWKQDIRGPFLRISTALLEKETCDIQQSGMTALVVSIELRQGYVESFSEIVIVSCSLESYMVRGFGGSGRIVHHDYGAN